MSTTLQHPLEGLRSAIEAIVDARIAAKLAQAGHGTPTPRALRMQRGIELVELASKSGINHSTLSRLEAGKIRRPKPATLGRIARALGISENEYRAAVAGLIANTPSEATK